MSHELQCPFCRKIFSGLILLRNGNWDDLNDYTVQLYDTEVVE